MVACDLHMYFTFVRAGWEGSVHYNQIFKLAIHDPKHNFSMPPLDPNSTCYIF